MDSSTNTGSSTLPRDFRFTYQERPTTPEPRALAEPPLPRPARLKVKRRQISSFNAPTQSFLASVAAADTPIPSIEIADSEMGGVEVHQVAEGFLSARSHFRGGSPPKTPIPTSSFDHQESKRPDWSRDTPSPAPDHFRRPFSGQSTASDCSDDSFYSGSRRSRPSIASTCTSPDAELADPFEFPSPSKVKGKAVVREPIITLNGGTTDLNLDTGILNKALRSKSSADAPWTKSQETHLWATYLQYLQDPTVTPFRLGGNSIAPEGVIHRVSRQAKRSWRGARTTSTALPSGLSVAREGSNTPTQESSVSYAAWPHSKLATRSRLRQLCKEKALTAVHCHRHRQSRSTTPFSKLNHYESNPAPFSTKDISLSLTTSTAESMQPDGPLAKLASDGPTITSGLDTLDPSPLRFAFSHPNVEFPNPVRPRLASAFAPQTYGPSSSTHLSANDRSSPPLRSPIKFTHSRSLTGTQKRPAAYDLEAELSPNGAVLRPSVLDEQLFGAPLSQRRVRSRGFSLGDEVFRRSRDPNSYNFIASSSQTSSGPVTPPSLLSPPSMAEKFGPPPPFAPARLRSPFEPETNSNTFPRRQAVDPNATVRRPAFATMHQSRRSIESFDFGPRLQSRLTQVDSRLKEIQEREELQKFRLPR